MATLTAINNKLHTHLALSYLERPANPATEKQQALILLHGVGSNEQDQFSLAPHIPDNFVVLSPRGPVILGEGRYAWYEVNFATGTPQINATQEKQSRETILDFIKQVKEIYGVDEVWLGGFSQGAIMSYSIGLTEPTEVAGIFAFSGRILQEIRPQVAPSEALKHLNVFIAHGTQDTTLPLHFAREASTYLAQIGITPAYHEFEMGHQLNSAVLEALLAWLKA